MGEEESDEGLGGAGDAGLGCRRVVGATDLGKGGRIWGVQGGGRWYRETGLRDDGMEAMSLE